MHVPDLSLLTVTFACPGYYHSAPVGEFGGDGEDEGRCPEATNAPPARNVPAPCAQVGAECAADEVAEHVDHVEPTPGAWVDAVDAGLGSGKDSGKKHTDRRES